MHAYRYPSNAKGAEIRFKFWLLTCNTHPYTWHFFCVQPTAPTPCNTCGSSCCRQAKTKAHCFGSSHLPNNCTRLATATIIGSCISHPRMLKRQLMTATPKTCHCEGTTPHARPKKFQSALAYLTSSVRTGISTFLKLFECMSTSQMMGCRWLWQRVSAMRK